MGFPGSANSEELPDSAGDARDMGLIPGEEDPLEEGMATYFSIPAWRILQTKEPGGLHRVAKNWIRLSP